MSEVCFVLMIFFPPLSECSPAVLGYLTLPLLKEQDFGAWPVLIPPTPTSLYSAWLQNRLREHV